MNADRIGGTPVGLPTCPRVARRELVGHVNQHTTVAAALGRRTMVGRPAEGAGRVDPGNRDDALIVGGNHGS